MIEHTITHYYQPTNKTCSQSSLAMVFSFFGKTMAPADIAIAVPVVKDDEGRDLGTLNQTVATWCLSQGFTVELHTADFQIIDTSWMNLSSEKLLERMELAKGHRNVPNIGKMWSERYMQSYIDFVKSGGDLHIEPYMNVELIDRLLPNSPLLIAVCYNVLYGTGRTKGDGLRQNKQDDITGNVTTHSVVVYGKDEAGNYFVADPWQVPGRHVIGPDRLLMAMAAAQIECDNLFFQLLQK